MQPISTEGLQEYIRRFELPARKTGVFGGEAEIHFCAVVAFVGSVIKSVFQFASYDAVCSRAYLFNGNHRILPLSVELFLRQISLPVPKEDLPETWHAPEGGLWGAMVYVNTLLAASRLLLPIAVGISCCEAIRQSGVEQATIRWINDILISGRKVAGFLLEGFHGNVSGEEYTLTGFGINLNNTHFPEELGATATSLKKELGRDVDQREFTYSFLAKLSWNLGLLVYEEDRFLEEQQWPGRQGPHALLERWGELSDSIGRRVQFGFDVIENPQYEARVCAISENGGLVLKLDDNSEIIEHSGEIRYLA